MGIGMQPYCAADWGVPARSTTSSGKWRSAAEKKVAWRSSHANTVCELAKGQDINKVAKLTGLGTGTVHHLKRQMAIGG
jgi:hypothetical protein